MCGEEVLMVWLVRACVSPGEFERTPSSDPKSFSRRSGVKLGVKDVPPWVLGCRRHIPSAVMRARLRSDAKIEVN